MTDERIDTTDKNVTNAVLQAALADYELPTSGTKVELQARLAEAYAAVDRGEDPAEASAGDEDEDDGPRVTPGGLLLDEGQAFVGDLSSEVAQALLEAAEDLDVDVTVVRTTSEGFIAPQDVVDKAFPDGVPEE